MPQYRSAAGRGLIDPAKHRSKSKSEGNPGGAERDRTADLVIANDALSQLSYSPQGAPPIGKRRMHCNGFSVWLRGSVARGRISR